ncbi:MAG: hypothetical protein EP349_07725 [Alphaproteobacteria bacterium]|nr:MAG: hypothetical protein EP349_07725 [Alphaproteobacteria bacterium]
MIRLLWQNLKGGFNLAFWRACPQEAFTPSWHSVVFAFALSAAVSLVADALSAAPPRVFYIDGLQEELAYFALLFFAAYIASLIFAQTKKTLLLATMLYNAFIVPWCLFSLIYALAPDLLAKGNIERDLSILYAVWTFLIGFRAVALAFDPEPLRQVLASLAVLAGLYFLPSFFYFDTLWYHDYSADKPSPLMEITHEELFQGQTALLDQQLAALKPSRAGHRDVYGIVFGSYGYQDVFMREVGFVAETLSSLYGQDARILRMINHEKTLKDEPLAIASNLRAALKHLGGMMQKEDVLLLYLTSHGGKDGTLSVYLGGGYRFHQMKPELLAEILQESDIQNRIIFVSACYSGMMLEMLKNDDTLIMTSAAKNRQAYGCSNDSRLTYFAEAYFEQAFPQEKDWIKAFATAQKLLLERETAEGKTEHSDPQIFIGQNISSWLPATLPQHWPEKTTENAE